MLQVKALSILVFTVGLSLARPRVGGVRIRPQFAAMLGALLTIGLGLLTPTQAARALGFLALPLLTIVSLMVITLVAEEAGLFRLLAWRVARLAGGKPQRLFALLFFTGTVTGAVFTNDAAVLIFTPLVYRLGRAVGEWRDLRQLDPGCGLGRPYLGTGFRRRRLHRGVHYFGPGVRLGLERVREPADGEQT